MSVETETPLLCSKCGEKPRADQDGTNPWCLDCRAEYQREYVAKMKKQTAEQAFARGVAAMRDCLAVEFEKIGSSGARGYEAAQWIRSAPGPKFEDDIRPRTTR